MALPEFNSLSGSLLTIATINRNDGGWDCKAASQCVYGVVSLGSVVETITALTATSLEDAFYNETSSRSMDWLMSCHRAMQWSSNYFIYNLFVNKLPANESGAIKYCNGEVLDPSEVIY